MSQTAAAVAGTLAHHVMSEPKEITTSAGDRVPVNLSIHYISFSAHSDFAQTSHFINELKPAHVVLVHGAEDLMTNLQRELAKAYDPKQVDFLMPKNCQPVQIHFHGDRMAKVVGSLVVTAKTLIGFYQVVSEVEEVFIMEMPMKVVHVIDSLARGRASGRTPPPPSQSRSQRCVARSFSPRGRWERPIWPRAAIRQACGLKQIDR